jgi:hypothetical protein
MSQAVIIGVVTLMMMMSSSMGAAIFMLNGSQTPKDKIAISNRPRSDIWGWTVYEGCSGEGREISDVKFGKKPTSSIGATVGHAENPEVGSIILKNASIEGFYKLGNEDFTINQGIGNKIIDFCQPDGTKATKFNFNLKL